MEVKRFKKYLIIGGALLLLIGFTFFRKPATPPKTQNNSPIRDLTERQEIETLAAQFIAQYGNYTTGDFSNLEKLLPLMSETMQTQEKNRITELRKSWEAGPKIYQTVETDFIGSTLTEWEQDRAVVKILSTQRFYDGAFINDPMRSGEKKLVGATGDNASALLLKNTTTDNNYKLTMIKQAGRWKVSGVEVITYEPENIEAPLEGLIDDDLILDE